MESKTERRFSILMFPWIAHGHVIPFFELAKNLSNKSFHIYFCSTAINLEDSTKNSLQEQSSIQLVELQLPSFPDIPAHFHTMKNVPPHLMPRLFHAFQMSATSFTDIIQNLKPDLLIYDVFSTYRDSPFPYPEIYVKDYETKGLKAAVGQLMKRDENEKDLSFGHFNLSQDIVLMKTCKGIDGKYVDYLSVLCKKKLVPVGPLVTQSYINGGNDSEIVDWLTTKPEFSTVFISFGSENHLTKEQMQELAKGLEICDVNFIWVIRSPVGETIDIDEVMPKGFLDLISERGLIVQGWAPQAKILSQKSVGAFVSHCGTSSLTESLYFGVPVIALPFKFDQPLNVGAGVEVARDEEGSFKSDDVANAINEVIVKMSGEKLRLRATVLSAQMKNEEAEDMNEAAEQLLQLCIKFKEQT
ncbi:crocetin glucoside glucosyltransferase-like [Dorcoceras hygrometricum]|uniref:Glycosyltransferase n=1 Tax=Dorcoceras hygrometricum TaxID=472368 RepID=A0A2Z7AJN5_9LAMI|nr:crocetin glucoside glucosyltransferase-like [Dorcoceras hygrometricum]